MPIRDLIILSLLFVSLPVCLFRPFFGILLWTVIAFLNPHRFGWGTSYNFPVALAVAIPTLLGFLFLSRRWGRLASREFLLVVMLWLWFTITSFATTSTSIFVHHAPNTWFRWGFVSKIMLMIPVTILVVDSLARLRTLLLIIAGCFGFVIVKTLPFMIASGGVFRVYGPPNTMIADNNDFGLALNMTLPLFFFLAQTESNGWLKRLFGFLFVVTIPMIFFTYSRGALIGLAAVLCLMFLQMKQRLVLAPAIALAFLVAFLFAPEAWQKRMDPTQSLDASGRSRLNSWMFASHLALDFPIFGGGFDTFTPELFSRYAPNPTDVHAPHSIYFQVLGEHGFAGLFLYLALIFSSFASLRRLGKLARLRGDQFVLSYATMFQVSLVGFLFSGVFLGRAYFDYFFTVVACIAILKRDSRMRWAETLVPVPATAEQYFDENFEGIVWTS